MSSFRTRGKVTISASSNLIARHRDVELHVYYQLAFIDARPLGYAISSMYLLLATLATYQLI